MRTPISKTNRAKWTGVVAQALGYLLWKHEAQSSNPIPTRKKNLKRAQHGDAHQEFKHSGK
jgi:hypothetical protein